MSIKISDSPLFDFNEDLEEPKTQDDFARVNFDTPENQKHETLSDHAIKEEEKYFTNKNMNFNLDEKENRLENENGLQNLKTKK